MFTRNDLRRVRPDREASIQRCRNEIQVRGSDKFGILLANIATDRICLAVAAYILDGSVEGFRDQLGRGAELRLELLRRYHAGAPLVSEGWHMRPGPRPPTHAIWKGKVSNAAFDWILYALAAARLDLAQELAQLLGDVPGDEFANAWCLSLKHIVLNESELVGLYLADLGQMFPEKTDYEYYRMLKALSSPKPDPAEVQRLVQLIDQAHRRYIGDEEVGIAGTEEALLCLWGIGLANLARYKGIVERIEFSSDLIPRDLLI